MADIRTIKIFLASSEELADERIRFGDFIRTLDDTYEQRGFRIKLIKWEDLPKAAQDYVSFIENAIGCPIKYISVGAERDSIIFR